MELYRKITEDLKIWLEDKANLIVYGPRQVGKTYILKSFIAKNFDRLYYLNLHNNISAIKTLIGATSIDDFLLRLSLLNNTAITENTCIFIDEIQEYYTYISRHKEIDEYFDIFYHTKTFVSEGKNRIVLSGSLLRLELNNLITAPTGYLLELEMYPLDFEEYLINNGVPLNIIERAKEQINKFQKVDDYIHNKFIKYLNEYILVGGMPRAVDAFIEGKNFKKLGVVHKEIERYVIDDITKYSNDEGKLKIKEIYDLIPTELSNPTRKFIISDIVSHNRGANETPSFGWLSRAGITIPVYLTSDATIPLIINSKRNQFKLFFEDVGLLSYRMFDNITKLAILNNEAITNKGFIYENFVAQELHAHGFSNKYYYNSRKYGEVDFLLEVNAKVLPIEVKSGKSNTIHRALTNILNIENYDLPCGIILSHENTKVINNLYYLPIYAVSFLDILKREQ